MLCCCFCFFFNDTSPTVIYALSLHDALPISSTLLLTLLTATMDGSRTTMPLFFAYTSVFAVPRSIARSFENIDRSDFTAIRIQSLLLVFPGSHCGGVQSARPRARWERTASAGPLRRLFFHDHCL